MSAAKSAREGTVELFLAVLASKLTQYDIAESKREAKRGRVNIYRLGIILKALEGVRSDVAKYAGRSDAPAMAALRKSLMTRFTTDWNRKTGTVESSFAPARNVLKQIDAWEKTGKAPSLLAK